MGPTSMAEVWPARRQAAGPLAGEPPNLEGWLEYLPRSTGGTMARLKIRQSAKFPHHIFRNVSKKELTKLTELGFGSFVSSHLGYFKKIGHTHLPAGLLCSHITANKLGKLVHRQGSCGWTRPP